MWQRSSLIQLWCPIQEYPTHDIEACMVPQHPVISTHIAMYVLQNFSDMALQCAVTSKQNHEAFNWKKKITTPE